MSGAEAPPVAHERPHASDLVVALCICAAAILYWTWDSRTNLLTLFDTTLSPAAAADVAPAQRALSNQLNDDGARRYAAADYPGAEAQFRKAIAANPASALGYSNLGAVLIPEHRYDDAIAALQKAIALDPTLTLARNNLAWAQQEKAKRAK